MLLPFLVRVAEWPPVWERAVHSVKKLYVFFVGVGQILCVSFFPFWYWGWDVECDCILSPDRCLSIYLIKRAQDIIYISRSMKP